MSIDQITDNLNKELAEIKKDPYGFAREMLSRYGCDDNPNEASFWFPEAEKTGFRVPKSMFVQLPVEAWYDAWCACLDGIISGPAWDKLVTTVHEAIPEDFPYEKCFFRTGSSSGKFSFDHSCRIKDAGSFTEAIASTWYEAEICGKPISRWLMFREFIDTDNKRPKIYGGLKLNTEVRIFWDADEKKVLGSFDYWYQASDEIKKLLEYHPEELAAYTEAEPEVRAEVARLTPALIEECRKRLPAMDLEGQWSVDFMWTGSEWVLIDMAVARQSAFYEALECATIK